MALGYHTALDLFRTGDFQQLIASGGTTRAARAKLDPYPRVVVSNALALAGYLDEAEGLAALDLNASNAILRSHAESTLALVRWTIGEVSAAVHHAQAALRLASETRQLERAAWSHVHLFRLLIEAHVAESASAALPDARRTVAVAGIGQVSAYLHTCVAVLEGQSGRLSEARRHCDISESLLKTAPNHWLAGQVLLLRGTVSALSGSYNESVDAFRLAKDSALRHGHLATAIAADSNLGHIALLTGDFTAARQTFEALLRSQHVPAANRLAAAGGLARVHLASGELEDTEDALTLIDNYTTARGDAHFLYQVRWASLTRAQLLARQGRLSDACAWLRQCHERYGALHDIPLAASVDLMLAQAHARMGQHADASRRLLNAASLGVAEIRELQGQYYYGAALAIGDSTSPLAVRLRDRALRLWAEQGIAAIRMEMDDQAGALAAKAAPLPSTSGATATSLESVVDSVASLGDIAHRPQLFGEEMLWAIDALGCAAHAAIIETRDRSDLPTASLSTLLLPLGTDHNRHLTLVCTAPEDPAKAVALAALLRLGRAALSLERAHEDEGTRAALWPAPLTEERADTLFVAEEMQLLLATARRIASTTIPVLITGETGTGKEVLARTIHVHSNRANGPFIPFNCSSVPRDMLASQLFGHRKGSFTGATEHFAGVIRAAAGGTLLLDEIGETTLDVQPKLLRFLESNEVHPIGDLQPIRTDVRVIAATNADLEVLVSQGRFREDLFYRLHIVRLHVPPLRDRRVEIPTLAHHFLQKHAQEFSKGTLRLAEETVEYLTLYRWPGNVRQLANEMRRLAAMAESDAVVMPEHLSADIAGGRRTMPASDRALDSTEMVVRMDQPISAAVQHLERSMIQHAIRRTGGRMEETAAMLGLSRKGLYLKRVRYGLEAMERTEPPRLA